VVERERAEASFDLGILAEKMEQGGADVPSCRRTLAEKYHDPWQR
jgi:hypothetical protein